MNAAGGIQAQQQFDAFQAAEAQVSLEVRRAAVAGKFFEPAPAAELFEQLPENFPDSGFNIGLAELCAGSGHCELA